MKAQQIIYRLWAEYQKGWHIAAPNVYAFGKYESDLLAVTKSFYTVEFEVKLTRADFRNDAKKNHTHYHRDDRGKLVFESKQVETIRGVVNRNVPKAEPRSKYDWLLNGDGANRLYYVVPRGLLKLEEVPAWAGLIECETYEQRMRREAKEHPAWAEGVLERLERMPQHQRDTVAVEKVRAAKELHKADANQQAGGKLLDKIGTSLYYRYWMNKHNTDELRTGTSTVQAS